MELVNNETHTCLNSRHHGGKHDNHIMKIECRDVVPGFFF